MKRNKKNTKIVRQLIIGIIMFTMISTGYVNFVKMASASGGNGDGDQSNQVTVRVYGDNKDQCTPYPNEAFNAYWNDDYSACDFIYKSGEDPFDPGVLSKDSITFNPAYIDMNYKGTDILVNGGDSSEKVALRTFYQPNYTHPMDQKMYDCSSGALESVEPFDAVVLETTYTLVTHNNDPVPGLPYSTQFVLPYTFSNPNHPGMDTADVLKLVEAQCACYNDGGWATAGEIAVEKCYHDIASGTSINFMDHTFTFVNYNSDTGEFKIKVKYAGNMYYAHSEETTDYLGMGCYYFFDRSNNYQDCTDACHRWFININFYHNGMIDVEAGRVLSAGETFYVNSVRYDMPAIYVEDYYDCCAFKYITFQTPLPKCTTQMWFNQSDCPQGFDANVNDWSHVTSQWLANLLPDTNIWVLPPFNEMHWMMDDIGLQKVNTGCRWNPDWEVPEKGLLLSEMKAPLMFTYVNENIEPRFDTSLAQVLSGSIDESGDTLIKQSLSMNGFDSWTWASVYTLPNQYTEFALPDQEIPGELYSNEPCKPDWYNMSADGNEYLLTSSFIGPNSYVCYDRWCTSKDCYCTHEIYDRSADLYPCDQTTWYSDYYGLPRVVFQYDATTNVDLYINQNEQGPTVRLYGEPGYIYPTESWSLDSCAWNEFSHNIYDWGCLDNDFVYPSPLLSFLPGAIPKDSITFNPACLGQMYHNRAITVNGADSGEKVLLRMFYEPNYQHCVDQKMSCYSPAALEPVEPFNAIVLETTYILLDHNVEPDVNAEPDGSNFMLPCYNNNSNVPGMDAADIVSLADVNSGPEFTDPYTGGEVYTDGQIAVEKLFEGVTPGQTLNFMDHTFKFMTYESDLDEVQATIAYQGNMYGAHDQSQIQHLYTDENLYFDRNNNYQCDTDPAHRWYLRIVYTSAQTIDIVLGRVLSAGETFYVDGVRYDMPAVYVACDNSEVGGFKYITFQTPLPKCDTQMWFTQNLDDNVNDWSHVSSQWLANLLPNTDAWVLPPFNEMHTMRDDINLIKTNVGTADCPDWEVPLKGLIINGQKGPLEIQYVAETSEPRFNTSLAERFYPCDDCWKWWSIYTLPQNYTEFLLPNQETTSDTYTIPDEYDWYPTTHADGAEYLVTSSWYAPNSKDTELFCTSKSCPQVHDIFDFLALIATWDTCHLIPPRVAFAFDAETSTGLYINGETQQSQPGDEPPTADANGPYSSVSCVTFSAIGSQDNDQNGEAITQYRWDIDNDGDWDTAWMPFSTPTFDYCYSGAYHGYAVLEVMDNEGDTATATTWVDISGDAPNVSCDFNGDGTLSIVDVRYLAMHLTGDPLYGNCNGCSLDINSDQLTNIVDARYLAMYLTGDPQYEQLYP
ncbi:MAG TPA: hypothetical protein VMT57_02695 [Candidatus Thermoplasmatota archaeon]|nr:hypothetical protein [Candidatus Thermoplasmatota archaeon]